MPYYATYTGHIQNGIFTTWDDCKKEIHKKPKYKKFKTYAEAEEFHKNGPTYVTDQPASETAYDIVDHAMQMFGGMGMTREMPLYLLSNKLRTMRIYDGPTEIHNWVVARDLLGTRD